MTRARPKADRTTSAKFLKSNCDVRVTDYDGEIVIQVNPVGSSVIIEFDEEEWKIAKNYVDLSIQALKLSKTQKGKEG